VPHVAVIQFRDGLIESSVLVQAGLLQNNDLPVAGVETAQKILDPDRPSNTLIKRAVEEARGQKFASGRQKQSLMAHSGRATRADECLLSGVKPT
jgi:hypothetical protein